MIEPLPTNKQVETAQQIDALLGSHRKWVDRLNKTLICGSSPADDLVAEDAHMRCNLGDLLETRADTLFPDQATHDKIYTFHKSIHDHAREMILKARTGETIDETRYESFLSDLKNFQDCLESTYDSIIEIINTTDPLTGAQNRSHMRVLLDERIAKTNDDLLSWVLMIDLDHFKSINDQYGHEVGDRVLKGFATVVRDHIRPNDLFFRYGGEEFLLCVSGVSKKMISRVAERLRVAISKKGFEAPNGVTFSITASFGVTKLTSDIRASDAIISADNAMYAAKHAGRNRVVFDSEL